MSSPPPLPSFVPEIRRMDELLAHHLPTGVKVESYKAKRLTANGENYGSTMLGVVVELSDGDHLECVAKMCPNSDFLRRMFRVQETFKKEIAIYEKIIPELLRFQKERGVAEADLMDVLPRCLGARINLDPEDSQVVDDDAVLLLENLKIAGFGVGDRMSGFDYQAARFILRDLARFHAVPVALRLMDEKRFDAKVLPYLDKINPFDSQSVFDDQIQQNMAEKIFECAREVPECAGYIDRCGEGLKRGEEYHKNPAPAGKLYGTISHNDFWVNNTMVRLEKTEKGAKVVENKMVDFQFYSYDSGIRDLIFFLYTSLERSLVDSKLDELMRYYFDTFVDCLERLGCDVSEHTFKSFMEEVDRIAPTEFQHVIIMLRPIFAENVMAMEKMDENIMTEDGMISELYKKILASTIVAFAEKKWI